jgi:hypothetical protein
MMQDEQSEAPSIDQINIDIPSSQGSNKLDKIISGKELAPLVKPTTLEDLTRTWLAIGLVIGLGVTLVAIGVEIFLTEDPNIKRELTILVWTSMITLVSGVLGYYFASKGN